MLFVLCFFCTCNGSNRYGNYGVLYTMFHMSVLSASLILICMCLSTTCRKIWFNILIIKSTTTKQTWINSIKQGNWEGSKFHSLDQIWSFKAYQISINISNNILYIVLWEFWFFLLVFQLKGRSFQTGELCIKSEGNKLRLEDIAYIKIE